MLTPERLDMMAREAGATTLFDLGRPAKRSLKVDVKTLKRLASRIRAEAIEDAATLALDMLIRGDCTRLDVRDAIRELARDKA